MGADDADRSHSYPPDRWIPASGGAFAWALSWIVIGIALVEYVRVGSPETGIPWNYPLPIGVIYLIAVVYALQKYHELIDLAKVEMIDVLERTDLEHDLFERENGDDTVTPQEVEERVDWVLDTAFHPVALFLGALSGGCFAIGVMWYLDAFTYYPYLAMNFAYGAGHGLFFAPILATGWLVWRAVREFIVDIDVLDPDGVGGYRQVGDSIVDLIIIGIVLVTLDFLVLSSVMFVDEPLFQRLVIAMYFLMITFLLVVAAIGVLGLRSAMLEIREKKVNTLREQFSEVESQYYAKLDRGEAPDPEAQHIETMTTIFQQFDSMGMWPINLRAFLRLASTAAGSGIIAAYQMDIVSNETAGMLFQLI